MCTKILENKFKGIVKLNNGVMLKPTVNVANYFCHLGFEQLWSKRYCAKRQIKSPQFKYPCFQVSNRKSEFKQATTVSGVITIKLAMVKSLPSFMQLVRLSAMINYPHHNKLLNQTAAPTCRSGNVGGAGWLAKRCSALKF